ncbi:hypothetical protein [Methylotenera sp.]|uniref:hypothetical protein n=1 Tax=Methylotenera sp. TaxID=2051956 RepID=UPI002ED805F5
MIEIHNFNEALQQCQSGVTPYRLLQDQAAVMLGICSNPHPTVANALDITNHDINWLLVQEEAAFSYSDYLGGNVYVCETEADLKQIQGCDFEWAETHGCWPNVTDMPMSWDSCDYLQESAGEPQWVIFLLCWNNAGGPVYYVPKHLWQMARVIEHIAATHNAWNS